LTSGAIRRGLGAVDEIDEEVIDSPEGWVASHIRRYVRTNGEKGHEWRKGVFTLLLTTRGRKTGKLHRTALIYGREGAAYVVVGSNAGSRRHPAWYHNLTANPDVYVQVKSEVFPARARTATGEERARLWKMMSTIWPYYEGYQRKTKREIPVVVLEPRP
jgi:deazaflavin-dependent oxidoreductase (nitroreductase family)